jgi:ferrous iron transport protein A
LKLSNCKKNAVITVKEILQKEGMSKLFEYGLTEGVKIKVLNIAPFNGPIFIETDSVKIAIRKQQALNIIVE